MVIVRARVRVTVKGKVRVSLGSSDHFLGH